MGVDPGAPGDLVMGVMRTPSGWETVERIGKVWSFKLHPRRNANIVQVIGQQFISNQGVPFNNAISNVVMTQGEDGEELFDSFDHIESYGGEGFINDYLENASLQRPKAYEYSRAINVALMILSGGTKKAL